MSLFGSLNTNSQPQQGGGGFGSSNQPQQTQQSGGLFGNLGQNNNQQQQQQGGSLFGSLGQNNQQQQQQPQQQSGGLFGGLGQSTQQQPQQQNGGLFGGLGQSTQQQQQPQQQGGGLFGGLGQNSQQQQQPQGTSSFGGFGQSTQQNQQSQQGGLFGAGSSTNNQQNQQNQPGQLNLGQSQLWQPENPQQKTIPEEIAAVLSKWDTASPNCAFRHYFYNKVDEQRAPYYRPGPNEDPKEWEEALSKKPGPGYIPVLCVGFTQMGERIKTQQRNLAAYNQKLHEINSSLDAMLSKHDLVISVRALDAKRRHQMLKQRCLTLAAKAQVLRNRGYALTGDEEDLKKKLTELEKSVCDPGLSARSEEIWARMVGVRERARLLREEVGKRAATSEGLSDDTVRVSEKLLEAYGQQLAHLKKEMNTIIQDYKDWEKEQQPNGR